MNPEVTLTNGQAIFMLSMMALFVVITLVQIYGTYVCFCKKWYMGLAALIVPAFALVVGIFKIFKKDILK